MALPETLIQIPPRRLFLIDALGALLSTIMLGAVLTTFEATFGMPVDHLLLLAGIAAGFALYSFSCFFIFPKKWPVFLRIIAVLNLAYSAFTGILLIRLAEQVTLWGFAYFVGEIILVVSLAFWELRRAEEPLPAS